MSLAAPPILYHHRDFAFFTSGRFLSTIAMQMQSVAIGWQIYSITNSAFALGLVGLCQFAPMFLLTLPAGDISDRIDQRKVLAAAMTVQAVSSALFLLLSFSHVSKVWPFYAVLVLFGAARGFSGPAGQSLVAFLVPEEKLARSIALSSSVFTTAVIAGPALGGFLYAFGPFVTYSVCCLCFLCAATLTVVLGGRRRTETVTAGSRLDRVAEGVGFLRAAPAVGAALTSLTLAKFPIERHTGIVMFSAVAVFGIATIVFGLSTSFPLSLAALFILGASDMISVFIRSTLIQFATPDSMRGRVSAVNMLFIGASNELGEFESGITAAWFGVVPAVIVGGIGTLAVVAIWMKVFPPLRTVDRLREVKA